MILMLRRDRAASFRPAALGTLATQTMAFQYRLYFSPPATRRWSRAEDDDLCQLFYAFTPRTEF